MMSNYEYCDSINFDVKLKLCQSDRFWCGRRHSNPFAKGEIDLDDTPGLSDPYRTPKLSFIAAKVALRLAATNNGDSPDQAVESNYHAGLVAPFCMVATRDFFQTVLTR